MLCTLVIVAAMVAMGETKGGWSLWTPWFGCTVTCGGGAQLRQRKCDNPEPTTAADNCLGDGVQTRVCNSDGCPIAVLVQNGGWGTWGPYSKCMASCGGGLKFRNRKCDNPPPNDGGRGCVGAYTEFVACNSDACQVPELARDGGWGTWGHWSKCSASCGGGMKFRDRKCDNPPPNHRGWDCVGAYTEFALCDGDACQVTGGWSVWGAWYGCTVTCGGGVKLRERDCNNPSPGATGKDCMGKSQESGTCNTQACATLGDWSGWTAWSKCSTTCGEGNQWRERKCDPLGTYCDGQHEETRPCNTADCARNDEFESKRRTHYNEFQAMKLAKQLMEHDDEEEEEFEDETSTTAVSETSTQITEKIKHDRSHRPHSDDKNNSYLDVSNDVTMTSSSASPVPSTLRVDNDDALDATQEDHVTKD